MTRTWSEKVEELMAFVFRHGTIPALGKAEHLDEAVEQLRWSVAEHANLYPGGTLAAVVYRAALQGDRLASLHILQSTFPQRWGSTATGIPDVLSLLEMHQAPPSWVQAARLSQFLERADLNAPDMPDGARILD